MKGSAPRTHKNIPKYCIGCISLNNLVPGLLQVTIKYYPKPNKVMQIKPITAKAAKPAKNPPNIKLFVEIDFDFAI